MKLAEALIERADLKAQISQIVARMIENTVIQEGDEPAEDIAVLLSMYDTMMAKQEELIICINKTNSTTVLSLNNEDISLAEAIAKRDCMKSKITTIRKVRESSMTRRDRWSGSEIKYVRTVDIAKLQAMIDDYSRRYRELDTKIQTQNWATDLV